MVDSVTSDDGAQSSSESEPGEDGEKTKCFVHPSSKFYDCMPDSLKGKEHKIHGNASKDKSAKVELTSVSADTKSDCYKGAAYEVEGKVPIKLDNKGIVHAQSILIHPDTGFTYILDPKCIRIQVFDPFLNYAWTIPLSRFSKWLVGVMSPDAFCFFRNYICVFGPHVNLFLLYFLTQSGEPVTKFRVPIAYDHWVDNIFSFEDYFYIPFYRYYIGLDEKDAAKNYSLQSNFTKHTLYLQCISDMEACEVILSKEFWPFCCESYSGVRFQGRDFYIAAYYYDAVNLNTIAYILKYSIDSLELVASVPLEIGLVSHFSTAGFLLDLLSDSFWFCDIDTNRILIFRKTGELIIGLERDKCSKRDNYNHRAAPLAINSHSSKLIVTLSDGEHYFQLIDLETLRQEISANI